MGKQLQRRISYGVHPHSPGGCFWGMFNVLDYHQWNYVKKLLHHKKHHGRRRLQCFATPKTVSFSFHGGEEDVDGDSEHLLGEHRDDQGNSQKPSSSKETSNKNRKHHRRNSSVISNQTNQIMIFPENAEDPYICFEEPSNKSDHTNAKFTKARSFPVPDGSGRRYRPSTMNHKQNEVWFFSKVAPVKILTLETREDNSEPTRKDASHGWNHLIKSQFKGFKKIIKRALQETRKETKKSSSKRKEEPAKEKSNIRQMTRLSSLNESADKYARLFDRSFSGNNATSNSLKLSFEDDKNVAKTYRRRHSLPDYETLISLLGEVSQETLYSGLLAWTKSEIEKSNELRPSFDIKGEQIAESGSRSGADLGIETDCRHETVFESGKKETPLDFDDEKIATVENKAVDQGAFLSFEGAELATWSHLNVADPIKLHHDPGSVKEIDPDFKFVSDILKSAGFIETESIPPWDSIELPLNPQLFDELEAPKSHDLECRDHQLLFDLINEALLEMYERLFSYFPRPFSFSPYTRPITNGKHVVDEVWRTVKGYNSTRLLECERSLDGVVARDMAKRDGWMSLEWDCECLAVELEDSILNDLIDELLYS